jgi:hypothetical protein
MFDFGHIIESFFVFFKKGFRTFFLSVFRPRYLFSKILKNEYQEILKYYVYFIIVFSVFNIFSNINSPYSVAEPIFINYCKAFLDSLFNTDLQSKLLLNLPLMLGVYVFFYLFCLLLKEYRSSVFRICLYLSASYLVISSSFADLLDILKIYLTHCPKVDADSIFQASVIVSSERYGYVVLGILIFVFFLISYLINKKSRPHFKINCSFLLLIWVSLFLNKSIITMEQKIILKEHQFTRFSIIGEGGRNNEIDIRIIRYNDSSFSVSANILFKNNLDFDLVLFKEKTMLLFYTISQSGLNGTGPELALTVRDRKYSEKFMIVKKSEFKEFFLVDTVNIAKITALKKRVAQGYDFTVHVPFLIGLSDSTHSFVQAIALRIISDHP